jgi:hypothetical protein
MVKHNTKTKDALIISLENAAFEPWNLEQDEFFKH